MRDTPPSASADMICAKRSFAWRIGRDHHVRIGPFLSKMFDDRRGTREVQVSPTAPRSMTSTETLGSSLNLEARTEPEVPPAVGRCQFVCMYIARTLRNEYGPPMMM